MPARDPEGAVVAYLGVLPDAYYSLDSTVVAPYVTSRQWIREDAYIQLNRVQNQAIEMLLKGYAVSVPAAPSAENTSTTLQTRETWSWRMWDLKTRAPKTTWVESGYDVRYTLERYQQGWLVVGTEVVERSGDTTATPVR